MAITTVSTFTLYLVLLKATLTSFSGFGSLPQVREDLVVRHQALSDEALNRSVLVARTTPGPMGVYVVSAGYQSAGLRGALAGWLALATPALLVVPLCGATARIISHRRVRGAISGLVLASAVLIIVAGVPLTHELVDRWTDIVHRISETGANPSPSHGANYLQNGQQPPLAATFVAATAVVENKAIKAAAIPSIRVFICRLLLRCADHPALSRG